MIDINTGVVDHDLATPAPIEVDSTPSRPFNIGPRAALTLLKWRLKGTVDDSRDKLTFTGRMDPNLARGIFYALKTGERINYMGVPIFLGAAFECGYGLQVNCRSELDGVVDDGFYTDRLQGELIISRLPSLDIQEYTQDMDRLNVVYVADYESIFSALAVWSLPVEIDGQSLIIESISHAYDRSRTILHCKKEDQMLEIRLDQNPDILVSKKWLEDRAYNYSVRTKSEYNECLREWGKPPIS